MNRRYVDPRDTDPMYVAGPEPVTRSVAESDGPDAGPCLVALVLAAVSVGVVIALGIWLTTLIPAPSSASLPRSHTDAGLSGAPAGEAIPRTRGIEPATTPDLAQQATVGAPPLAGGRPERPWALAQSEPASSARSSDTWAMHGVATHYPACRRCGAASGELQDQLGRGWKGRWVHVVRVDTGASVNVRLVTGCGCDPRSLHGEVWPTVLDLSVPAFEQLASYGTGVIEVEVTPIDGPPKTDTAP